jgi:hypothetical protein
MDQIEGRVSWPSVKTYELATHGFLPEACSVFLEPLADLLELMSVPAALQCLKAEQSMLKPGTRRACSHRPRFWSF